MSESLQRVRDPRVGVPLPGRDGNGQTRGHLARDRDPQRAREWWRRDPVRDPVVPETARSSQPPSSASAPRVGFSPTRPQAAAGIRIDPPPSAAVAIGASPAATAAAEPPEEPPGVRDGSHGLRVIPLACEAVHGKIISSGTFVIATGIAPAARSRASSTASSAAGVSSCRVPKVAV
jgi:hypothetical protein